MKLVLRILSILIGLGISSTVLAATYTPIVGFPGLNGASSLTAENYLKALYTLSITVAGLLAVVKIIFSGVRYMLSDIVTTKSDAIKEIRGALLGLLIVLCAVLILNTINPDLNRLKFLGSAPALTPVDTAVQQPTETPLPNPDTKIGETLDTSIADPDELAHFKDSCPGTINQGVNTSGGIVLSCDNAPDVVAQAQLSCLTNGTCTCDYSSTQNRGICYEKCQTTPPDGYAFAGTTDLPNYVLQCNFTAENDQSKCDMSQSIFSCPSSSVGGPLCDQSGFSICTQVTQSGLTLFYGFKN